MKLNLDKEAQEELQEWVNDHKIHKWFQAKENMKFQVGDILVKYDVADWDEDGKPSEWNIENINSDTKMAQRYIYLTEDQYGIGWIKTIKISDGKLGAEFMCLADFDYDSVRFEVDPEFAEATLLGGEFNIKEIHRRSLEGRKMCIKANRKIGVKPTTLSEYNKIFATMKKNQKFYVSRDYTGRRVHEYTFKSAKNFPVKDYNLNQKHYSWQNWISNNPSLVDTTEVIEVTYRDQWGENTYLSKDIFTYNKVFFAQKPMSEEENK